ncbi:MAG: alpha/beta fold hydrolase [Acidobacteria bacterium]|nr:alpha/beta fold hydrolase [Acidobacteriota bacterium]
MSSLVIHIPFVTGAGAGELTTTEAPAAPLVVFAHGAGAGHQSPFIRRFAALLAARGMNVLTFDFPYMAAGRKLPDRPPALEAAFRAAIDAGIGCLEGRIRGVVVAGKSMGGRMATHVAAQPDEWTSPVPLIAAVAFGYPLRPPGPRGGDRVSHLARLTVPTLIVQGTRDTFGGPGDVRAAVPATSRLHVIGVESGDHSLKVLASGQRPQAEVDNEVSDQVARWILEAAEHARPATSVP